MPPTHHASPFARSTLSSDRGVRVVRHAARCLKPGDLRTIRLPSSVSAAGAAAGRVAMQDPDVNITMLLRAAASGERRDLDALMSAVYGDMRRLAASHMRGERSDHTLQPTALVHEAYAKLIDQRNVDWKDRLHFFAVASRIIRRILIDHARERLALKRGGGGGRAEGNPGTRIHLDDHDVAAPARSVDLLALDEALAELAELDEQQARIVELRFFGGCSIEEVAELLGIGRRTVDRDWQAARAWLYCRIADEPSTDSEFGDD